MAKLSPLPSSLAALALLCLLLLHAAPTPAQSSRSAARGGVSFAGAGSTIHQLLKDHGLPGGLLPRGVVSYTLDESSGLLKALLPAPCYAKYDNGDMAFFNTSVSGNLSVGSLSGVEGLSQEELFVWLPVKGILVKQMEPGVILFDIGLAKKSLSRSLFEDPPDCIPSAADAASLKDRRGVPGLRLRREVAGDGEQRQEQR